MSEKMKHVVQQAVFYTLIIAGAASSFAPGYLPGSPRASGVLLTLGVLAALGVLTFSVKIMHNQVGLVATTPFIVTVASVSAVVLFLGWPETTGVMAPVAGCVLAILLWCVAGDWCRGCLTAERCNQSSFGELQQRLTLLDTSLEQIHKTLSLQKDPASIALLKEAYDTAQKECAAIRNAVSESGPYSGMQWVMASGYINLWKCLHRAEEALIEVLPQSAVISGALNDESRLVGSKIENRDELLAKLRRAVVTLDPSQLMYLKLSVDESKLLEGMVLKGAAPAAEAAAQQAQTAAQEAKAAAQEAETAGQQSQAAGQKALAAAQKAQAAAEKTQEAGQRAQAAGQQARSVLHMVRRTINEYQDDLYGSLVTTRNLTWKLTVFTGVSAFMLIAIAMLMSAPRDTIVAGATFYLVGATVGLLARLRGALREERNVADYGLSNARLFSIPLFCGMVAVGGVVLTPMLPKVTATVSPRVQVSVMNDTNTVENGASMTNPPSKQIGSRNEKAVLSSSTNMETTTAHEDVALAGESPRSQSEAEKNQRDNTGKGAPHTEHQRYVPSLATIFDLKQNLIGLFVAALYGLTPELLFARLQQQQTEKTKGEIKAIESTQKTGAA